MNVSEIEAKIGQYKSEGKRLFVTSSFQTHSIPLLHILTNIDAKIPVYFLNTGYLFPETLAYKDEISKFLGIDIRSAVSEIPRHMQRDSNGNLLFASDPDYCCYLNKTQPVDKLLAEYDIWISGIRADQNANRRNMKTEQEAKFGKLRFHPMLDWSGKMIFDYIKTHNLPRHPLDAQGYSSIGCEPCTRKVDLSDSRQGRWFGMKKTECGLHTDLVQ